MIPNKPTDDIGTAFLGTQKRKKKKKINKNNNNKNKEAHLLPRRDCTASVYSGSQSRVDTNGYKAGTDLSSRMVLNLE
jgi:hypothetical protein